MKRFPTFPKCKKKILSELDMYKSWAEYTKAMLNWNEDVAAELTDEEIKAFVHILSTGPVPLESIHFVIRDTLESLGLIVEMMVSKAAMPNHAHPFARTIYIPGYIAATERSANLFKTLMKNKRCKDPYAKRSKKATSV